jgi:hypothetical protein
MTTCIKDKLKGRKGALVGPCAACQARWPWPSEPFPPFTEPLPEIDYELALKLIREIEPIPSMLPVPLRCMFCRRCVPGEVRVRRGAKVQYACEGCRAEGREL